MHISLRNYQFSEGIKDDVRGSTVYGVNEEQLGKIDGLIFDNGAPRSLLTGLKHSGRGCWCNADVSTLAFQSRPRIPAEPRGGFRMTSLYKEKLG